MAMLSAFKALVPLANISAAYETGFMRNLPGGGLSGLQPISLQQRIQNAAAFASSNPLYRTTGEGIAENVRAIIALVPENSVSSVLAPVQATLQDIINGNL